MALTQIVNDGLGASLTATSEGGAVTTSIQQGVAKAWINMDFSSSAPVAQDSFGASVLTDNAAGDVTVSFSSAFGNANYVSVGMGGNTTNSLRTPHQNKATHTPTTTQCRYQVIYSNGVAPVDPKYCGIATLGDLA